jgi:hypothetical protein
LESQAIQTETPRLGHRDGGEGGSNTAAAIGGIGIHVEYFALPSRAGSAASTKGRLGDGPPPGFREPAKEPPRDKVGPEQGGKLVAPLDLVQGARIARYALERDPEPDYRVHVGGAHAANRDDFGHGSPPDQRPLALVLM